MSEERLASITETRQRLGGIGRTKVYELIESDLETVKIGRRRLVVSSSIDRLVERLRCNGEGDASAAQEGEADAARLRIG